MYRFFYDPTEGREGGLPDSIKGIATPLPGLEGKTGADILITPLGGPVTSDYLLIKNANAGALVQRKGGTDLLSSITAENNHLYDSLYKMRAYSNFCLLLSVGRYERAGTEGKCAVGYRGKSREGGMKYKAVQGALLWWQLRGGMFLNVEDDAGAAEALMNMGRAVEKLAELKADGGEEPAFKLTRTPAQKILNYSPQEAVLQAFYGIGPTMAGGLMDYTGSLAWALAFISDTENIAHASAYGLPGNGWQRAIEEARRIMGLEPGQIMTVIDKGEKEE